MATLTASRAGAGHYLAAIERAERDRAHEPAWLRDVRRSAADAFGRMGIPTTRDEEWRVTNVAPIADTPFAAAPLAAVSPEEAARFLVPGLAGPLLVFVNGRYAAELSAPGVPAAGLTVSTIGRRHRARSGVSGAVSGAPLGLRRPPVRGAEHGALRRRRARRRRRQHRGRPACPVGVSVHGHAVAGDLRAARARRARPQQPGAGDRDVRQPRARRAASRMPSPRSSWATAPCWSTAGSSASPSRRSTSATRRFTWAGPAVPRRTRSPSAAESPDTTPWRCLATRARSARSTACISPAATS